MSASVKAAAAFAIQVVVGGVMFLIVFGVAAGIGFVLRAAERAGLAPPWLAAGTTYIEVAVWVIDVAILALFILAEAIRFVRAMDGFQRRAMTRDVSKAVAGFVIQEARDAVRTYFAPLRAVADAFVRASRLSLSSQPVRSKPTEAQSTL